MTQLYNVQLCEFECIHEIKYFFMLAYDILKLDHRKYRGVKAEQSHPVHNVISQSELPLACKKL
jgi:hypothetical protein